MDPKYEGVPLTPLRASKMRSRPELLGSSINFSDAQWPWEKKGTLVLLVELKGIGTPKKQQKGSNPLGNRGTDQNSSARSSSREDRIRVPNSF